MIRYFRDGDFLYLRMTQDWYSISAKGIANQKQFTDAVKWCANSKNRIILNGRMQDFYTNNLKGTPELASGFYNSVYTLWFEDKNDAMRFRLIWG